MGLKKELLACLNQELQMQAHTLKEEEIETIYFGGGTPSLLSYPEINEIIGSVKAFYRLSPNLEITIEANPDDLEYEYLKQLYNDTPINRLSIGVQSFHAEDLEKMNRAHTFRQSHQCIENALKIGFENITIDLIFGAHTTTDERWNKNLYIATDYEIPHISIYGLTVEPKTALAHFIEQGKYPALDEEQFRRQFVHTQNFLGEKGYQQYEVSNYCTDGMQSRHNSAYWDGIPYLGIGPASHSFLDNNRHWNVSNNKKYIEAITEGKIPSEMEELTDRDRFNEYIMTGLRLSKGCSIDKLHGFDKKYTEGFWLKANELLTKNVLQQSESHIFINSQHRIMTDSITQELFCLEE